MCEGWGWGEVADRSLGIVSFHLQGARSRRPTPVEAPYFLTPLRTAELPSWAPANTLAAVT